MKAPANMQVIPSRLIHIPKENWADTKVTITFQALKGIVEDRPLVKILAFSDDPKYNGTALSIDALVQMLGKMPKTTIIAKPHAFSAWRHAFFTIMFFSKCKLL